MRTDPSLRNTSFRAAFWSGAAGAMMVTFLMAAARALSFTAFSTELILGSSLLRNAGIVPFIAGLAVQLLFGGLLGLGYAAVFHRIGRTGPRTGTVLGFFHWVAAGLLVALVPVPRGFGLEPGLFAVNYGWFAVFLFFAAHLLYGATVGNTHAKAMASAIALRLRKPEKLRAA